jgi:hypothetical protein
MLRLIVVCAVFMLAVSTTVRFEIGPYKRDCSYGSHEMLSGEIPQQRSQQPIPEFLSLYRWYPLD